MKDFFKLRNEEHGAGEFGTDELTNKYREDTPGEGLEEKANFTDKQIKMAYGILNDPRYKGGNLTAAAKKIEQIAKGLSKHPGVMKAMRATSEALEKGKDDPCWKDYVQLGTKKKNGKEVPNCVPKEEAEVDEALKTDTKLRMAHDKKKRELEKQGKSPDFIKKSLKMNFPSMYKEAANRYNPLQMAKAKKEREERRKAAGHDKETQAQRMRRKAYGNYMGGLKKESVEQLDELDAKTQKKFVAGAKAMKAYAQKNGGIDKADFMKAAKMMDDIARINLLQAGPILSRLNRFVDGLDTDVRERIYVELQKVGLVESAELPDPIIAEELKVSDGVAKWITDFKDSDAPQFAGKSDEEKKKMAIAAFMAAKAKEGGGEKKTEGYKSYAQQKAVWATRKDGGKGHPDNKKKNEAVEHVTEGLDPPLVTNAIANAKKALQQAKRELTVAKGKHASQGVKVKSNKAIKAIDMAMKEI